MLPHYTPCKDGILGSYSPITEWWMFTNLYHQSQSWSDWSLANCDAKRVLVMFVRDRENNCAFLNIFGDYKLAVEMLRDCNKFFKVSHCGKTADWCPFEQVTRHGESFLIEMR